MIRLPRAVLVGPSGGRDVLDDHIWHALDNKSPRRGWWRLGEDGGGLSEDGGG